MQQKRNFWFLGDKKKTTKIAKTTKGYYIEEQWRKQKGRNNETGAEEGYSRFFWTWIRMVIYEATKDLIDFGVVASFRCLVLYRRADIKLGVSFAFPYE